MSLEDYFRQTAASYKPYQGIGPPQVKPLTEVQVLIINVCNEIKDMLLSKNQAYGNSFSDPVGVFAGNMNPMDQLNVRIDDKLKRIKNGDPGFNGEDTELDIIGYLILKQVLRRMR